MVWDVLTGFDPTLLVAFVLAGLVLNFTPGADFLYITACGIQGGPKIGIAAAVGINLGIIVHIAAAAGGVSALLLAHPAAYDLIRYAGAAYLLWLAWNAWTSSGVLAEGRAAPNPRQAIRRGFLTNVLNPKTALFIFAFIPQFTVPDIGPIWLQILILGGIFLVNGLIFALCLGLASGGLGTVLQERTGPLNKVTAMIFGGLAARLLID